MFVCLFCGNHQCAQACMNADSFVTTMALKEPVSLNSAEKTVKFQVILVSLVSNQYTSNKTQNNNLTVTTLVYDVIFWPGAC